jgi:hypothetical protein
MPEGADRTQLQARAWQTPVWPKRQQFGAVPGHCAAEAHRTAPPANVHTDALTQLVALLSRLRQQMLLPMHALLLMQPMLAPPVQLALASIQVVEFGLKQQVCCPGMQVV